MQKRPYRIKMLNLECVLASWNAEFVYQITQGPNVRFGVVGLLLHQFRLHVVWDLSKIDEYMRGSDLGSDVPQRRRSRNSPVLVLLKGQNLRV